MSYHRTVLCLVAAISMAAACGKTTDGPPPPAGDPAMGDPNGPPPSDPGISPDCGNGTLDAGEGCDDGNGVLTDACPDGPTGSCQPAACGDGFQRADISDPTDAAFEACDDGAGNSDTVANACRTTCRAAGCGDGVVDDGEGCDDGDGDDTDACPDGQNGTCQPASCGDGIVRLDIADPATAGYESCDDGANNSDTAADACRTTCVAARCGDGVTDNGEGCDDGNADNGDGCTDGPGASCQPATCGDGFTRTDISDPSATGYENCDNGALNSDTVADACRLNCVAARCGDDVIDNGETCDDGASNSDTTPDACRLDCQPARCGDGVIDPSDDCNLEVVGTPTYPVRVAITADNRVWVTDPVAGSVFIYDAALTLQGELKGIDQALGIAANGGIVYVSSDSLDRVDAFSLAGERVLDFGTGELQKPNDLALDADGNIYVVDSLRNQVVVFAPDGTLLRTLGVPDDRNGAPAGDELAFPAAITIAYRAGNGEVYVADQANYRVVVFDLQGNPLRAFGSERVYDDDWQGKFDRIQSLSVDASGRVHAADCEMNKVQVLGPVSGTYITDYGEFGSGPGQLSLPLDISVTSTGAIVVTNAENHRVDLFPAVP